MSTMRASQIYDAIVASHADPEWAVLSEVSDATGGRASRRADAVALNLWPSRGLEVRGFEIKVSRGDLKRELLDPSKADAVGIYCHTWCLATPVGLVRADDTVPATWGLFEVAEDGGGRFKRLPTSRPATDVKEPTRMFMAAIARAATAEVSRIRKSGEWIRQADIQARIDAAFTSGHNSAPKENEAEVRALQGRLDNALPILKQLGIDIDGPSRYEFSANRHLTALKIGHALMHRWGDEAAARIVKDINEAVEQLTKAAQSIGELVTKADEEENAA